MTSVKIFFSVTAMPKKNLKNLKIKKSSIF